VHTRDGTYISGKSYWTDMNIISSGPPGEVVRHKTFVSQQKPILILVQSQCITIGQAVDDLKFVRWPDVILL